VDVGDIMPLVNVPSDITTPSDFVRGVPDDGDWPGGGHPALAIDNNVNTKYMHFKGDFDAGDPLMGAGIQITPADGESIVTGLTFTTANDATECDPVVYALYGSMVSIDGPYELIACGYIDDFAREEAWPRFTKNETEIVFDNDVIYEHYQLQFIDIRDIASANSMQIGEIELLGIKLHSTNPEPADGEVSVGIDDDLSWTSGALAFSHDVYFGTEFPLPFAGNVAGLEPAGFDPGVLEYGTTYYWQVDAVEEDGTVRTGAVNSFTTTSLVGLFEYTQDIGGPAGIGRTTYVGYVWKNDTLSEQYQIMGGGGDIAGSNDQFHFAYNRVSGNVRISASFEWITASDDWAKMGVMLRAGSDGDDISHSNITRKDSAVVNPQHRSSKGGGNGGPVFNTDKPIRLGIQRTTAEGLTWIQSLADFGNGWESMEVVLADNLPDVMLAGICITSHDNNHLAQACATDITYQLNPELVGDLGLAKVPADADLGAPTSDVSGFSIRSLKPLFSDGWGYDAMNELLETGMWMGLPAMPGSEGTRIDEFVNLYDTDGRGAFSDGNGYPDATFPGIDPLEIPAQDPAAGDDDDDFATEILGCIQLTAGLHYIGANSDDGTIVEIGGVEVARTGEWKGASNEDFLYIVEADGYYNLRARTVGGGGGASIELHEIFMDGTRILLNDVAKGGSAVFAPAP